MPGDLLPLHGPMEAKANGRDQESLRSHHRSHCTGGSLCPDSQGQGQSFLVTVSYDADHPPGPLEIRRDLAVPEGLLVQANCCAMYDMVAPLPSPIHGPAVPSCHP